MSIRLDTSIAQTGTKFRVFSQPRILPSFSQPETIRITVPSGGVQAGPADSRMFVIDAINKRPYATGETPPYLGPRNPPVAAGPDGHFDHLQPGTREFSAAHMYAVVRRVLDIWEDYFGAPISWHFELSFERLLLIPLIRWDNAQSGYGFLEFGYSRRGNAIDLSQPYCENFDVLSHELGHSIIFSQVGFPQLGSATAEYGGFHESAGDLVAILSSLHFQNVVDHLITHTKGNLFTVNELERVGELSTSDEIRSAFNSLRMSDIQSDEPHDLSQPLTGAIFDVLVEVFQRELVDHQLITRQLADRSSNEVTSLQEAAAIQAEFQQAYTGREESFRDALLRSRDYLGQLLAKTWSELSPHFLTYADVGRKLLAADRVLSQGAYQTIIQESFAWRGINLMSNPFAATPHRWRHE